MGSGDTGIIDADSIVMATSDGSCGLVQLDAPDIFMALLYDLATDNV